MAASLYYRARDGAVVLRQNGTDVDCYPNAKTLVETHIKGLLVTCADSSTEYLRLMNLYRAHNPRPQDQ